MNNNQLLKQFLHACLVGTLLLSSACSPKVDTKGYITDQEVKEQLVEGKTTKDQVMSAFGSPSSQSTFGDDTWYYISSRKEGYAFFKPDTVDQHVVRIQFDDSGIIRSVQNYTKDNAEKFSLVSRTTPTEGHSLGFFEQLFGNLGRFNRPSGNDTVAPGRKPGP